ncbi:MAG: glycosyltransferase family 39 protein [Chloroflexi bacterium]|nr:glycosyltransferase family 39 protein [Chloroflexota bacterium]
MKRFLSPLALIVLLGALLRLAFLFASQWMVEGDEAAVGLQALHILRGQFAIFYPGQAYLGNLESYLTAVVFAVTSPSRYALKIVPFAYALASIALSYALGRVVFRDERTGLFAALLTAVAPVFALMWSLKARGGYVEALVYVQLAWLWLHRAAYPEPQTRRTRTALGAGVIAGYGLWMNPIALYFLAPLAIVYGGIMLARIARRATRRDALGLAALIVAGAAVGLLPMALFRLAYGDAAFGIVSNLPPRQSWPDIIDQAWQYFWRDGLTALAGLRGPKDKPWSPDWRLIVTPLYAVALLALIPRTRKSAGDAVLLLAALLALPVFAFGALTGGNFAAIIPDSGLLTRYLLPLGLLSALALARLFAANRILAAIGLALLLAVNLFSAVSTDTVALARNEFANQPLPASYDDLIADLNARGIRHVYTNHWIGYLLTLESRETILTHDYSDAEFQMDRFPDYSRAVLASPNSALVVFNPHYEPNPIDAQLRQMNVAYRKSDLASFIVYYDMQPFIKPAALDRVLQWPYY